MSMIGRQWSNEIDKSAMTKWQWPKKQRDKDKLPNDDNDEKVTMKNDKWLTTWQKLIRNEKITRYMTMTSYEWGSDRNKRSMIREQWMNDSMKRQWQKKKQ